MVIAAKNSAELADWKSALEKLARQVEAWSEARGWLFHRESKTIRESQTGSYRVPVLTIQTNQGRVRIEPVGLYIMGAKGRVDMYAWPSLRACVRSPNTSRDREGVVRKKPLAYARGSSRTMLLTHALTTFVLVDYDKGWRALDEDRKRIAQKLSEKVFERLTQELADAA